VPEQTIIAWDLETIPDLAAAARMLGLGLATEPEVRDALGPGFPKHPLHKIVCIGALVASRQPEGWRVDALGAPLFRGSVTVKQLDWCETQIRDFVATRKSGNPHLCAAWIAIADQLLSNSHC
jgi:hypothetical protein